MGRAAVKIWKVSKGGLLGKSVFEGRERGCPERARKRELFFWLRPGLLSKGERIRYPLRSFEHQPNINRSGAMKIVVLDGYTLNPGDNPWDPLAALGDLTVYDRTNPEDVLERSRGAEILITNKTRLNADTLAALPDLRCIGA